MKALGLTLLILIAATASDAAEQLCQTDLTPAALKAASPAFAVPYPNAPGELVSDGKTTVYRPNHGIAQGARDGILVQDVINSILTNPNQTETKSWLTNKIQNDPNFLKKISLASLSHRSGRTDESESIGIPSKRTAELATSAANFEKSIASSGIEFSPAEIEDYKKAIQLDGHGNSNSEQSHMTKIIRAAHVLDLLRMGMRHDSEVANFLPDLSAPQISILFTHAKGYIDATGASYSGSAKFMEVSTNPDALAKALCEKQRAFSASATPHRLASNCAIRNEKATTSSSAPYRAVVRANYIGDDGAPAVDFSVVSTANPQATDEELYRSANFKRPEAKLIEKLVVHGPTTDNLDSIISATTCDDWVRTEDSKAAADAMSVKTSTSKTSK